MNVRLTSIAARRTFGYWSRKSAGGCMMTTREQDVRLANGRVLRVLDTGGAGGHLVVVLHGTPASRRLHEVWVTAAADAGLRLLVHDRPGYGGSTPWPGRTMADTAADVAAIADELGVDRFAVWGTSGGGPHALACVALLTDRVVAAAVVASYAPYDAAGLDFFAGMSEGGTQLLKLTTAGRDALHQVLSQAAEAVRLGTPEQWIEQMSPMVSPPDRALFDAKLAAAILADWREGLRPGVEGWVDDYLALLAPWGIDLGSVRAPVRLWFGELDWSMPAAHGRWLADAIPGAELRMFPDEGHFSLQFGRYREVMDWLAGQLRGGR
jgi:pimeloyl-ACP methyl ester carboxylesterase